MGKKVPSLSIITPAYNAEKYVSEMIESVGNQTFRDYEHIIVDDGSTDSTSKIINKYARDDPRIIYIGQKNTGPSAARNRGIEVASGKYITFIDADDLYDKNTLQALFNKAEKTNADIVFYNFIRFHNSKEYGAVRDHIELDQSKVYTKKDISDRLFNVFPLLTWNKLIKTSLLRKNNIHFNQKYLRDEDVDFSARALLVASKYAYADHYGYYYRINNPKSETATNNKYPTELLKIVLGLNEAVSLESPEIKQSFNNYAIDQIVGSIDRQEFHSSAHKEVFNFASDKVIPALKLTNINRTYLYKPELFGYLSSITKGDYEATLLHRIRMLEVRIRELDRESHDVKHIINEKSRVTDELANKLKEIELSLSWRMTKPLRAVNSIRNKHVK